MLIPRFSLRLLLVLMTVCAVFFFLVMLATRGQHWAIAASIAIAGFVVTMLLHASVFALAWLLAVVTGSIHREPIRKSPFATAGPPEQMIPPIDPE